MQDFLAEVSLATDQDEQDTAEQRVTLMTAHAAKGLEFNNVIVVGVEEELFPSAMASGSLGEIEEERRLLYVAVTRAKNSACFHMRRHGSRTARQKYASRHDSCATSTHGI